MCLAAAILSVMQYLTMDNSRGPDVRMSKLPADDILEPTATEADGLCGLQFMAASKEEAIKLGLDANLPLDCALFRSAIDGAHDELQEQCMRLNTLEDTLEKAEDERLVMMSGLQHLHIQLETVKRLLKDSAQMDLAPRSS